VGMVVYVINTINVVKKTCRLNVEKRPKNVCSSALITC